MSRRPLLITVGLVTLVVAVVLLVIFARRQPQEAAPPQVYSVGMLQEDGSLFYSVMFFSGPDARGELTIAGGVPGGVLLAEPVSAPAGARVVAAGEGEVRWEVDSVDAATILGPFTYRVRFDGERTLPASLPARAAWNTPSAKAVEATVTDAILQPPAQSGTLTLDPGGTRNDEGEPWPVQVGQTGIWLFAPEGTVAAPVTLTFTRLPMDETSLPQDTGDLWWCSLVQVESDAPLALAKPILLGLPTRRVLTVGMPVQVLGQEDSDEAWESLSSAEGLRIGGGGELAALMLADRIPARIAVGVNSRDQASGTASGGGSGGDGGFGGGNFNSGFGGGGGSFGGFQGFGGGVGGLGGFNGFQEGSFGGGGGPGGFSGTLQRP